MRRVLVILAVLFVVSLGCKKKGGSSASLVTARQGFQTKLVNRGSERDPIETPPANLFRVVKYPSAVGDLAAYLTPDPNDGKKHPAIVWITGGDCNSIGDVWTDVAADNDQTAGAYRKAGVVMMFPSLRGGNQNPGNKEGFLGEVDDVIAAADYLAKQPYVDPQRIYLGGHSTGGTLVLLVAECTDRFRATFSFGPAAVVGGYPEQFLPFDTSKREELAIRSPVAWLASIRTPTFVLEGTEKGNLEALQALEKYSKNENTHFVPVQSANHFNVLAPVNQLIAKKVISDVGSTCNISFTAEEVSAPFRR